MTLGLVVVWLGLYLALGAIALPFASYLFRDFVDHGAGLAVPVAFGTIAFTVYWIGQVTFGLVTAVLAVVILGTLSGLALRNGATIDRRRARDAAFVFTIAYLFLIAIRFLRPGAFPGGGEKFLDFGLLASLLRTTALPPEDMWFAGESVQYYYGGHMLAAVFSMLTDTAPRYAYNTALAGYYAAYVTAAWGLAGVLAAELDRSYRLGGALGAFFIGLASNLSTPVRLLVWLLPEGAGKSLADQVGIDVVGLATGPLNFNYWYASRVIHGDVAGEWQLITEFPFFAFLNGDLHGHMMSPLFLLLGAGFAFAYWKRPEADRWGRLLRLLAIAPIGGLLVLINTWSAPAVFGIALLTLWFAPAAPWTLFPSSVTQRVESVVTDRPIGTEAVRIAVGLGIVIPIVILGALSVLPFLTGAASGRAIGFLPSPRSNFGGLILVYGAFIGISGAYLASRARRQRWLGVAIGLVILLVVASWFRATGVILFGSLLMGGWFLVRSHEELSFETVLLVGGMGLLLIIEFVYIIEKAGPGRMNTVFKLSAQIWALLSVAAGGMGAWLVGKAGLQAGLVGSGRRLSGWFRKNLPGATRPGTERDRPIKTPKQQRRAAVLILLLVLSLAIYPIFGTGWAVVSTPTEPTLDAHSYMETDHPAEFDAIRWIANRSGQPTMVSAPGTEIYQWVNGPSSMTGVPTVAGWAHEIGYRGPEVYQNRVRDVDILFETEDAKSRMTLLEKYDVTYIYVGPIERDRYDPSDFAAEPGITTAYADGNVTIYRVE